MPPVEPKLLKGFRDLLPSEMIFREWVITQVKEVFESYGFVPLSTPALEHKDILLGYGEEAKKQIYLFQEPEGCEVGLRFDLTVPLSRVVALYRDLPKPFKRYQVQPVWRYDKPDPGRFREFIQFDIDTVGTDSMIADAEIIVAIHESLSRLGLKARVRFSNRKVLNSLMEFAGIPENLAHAVFRVLDKLEKQGRENVILELGGGRIDESGARIDGLGLASSQIARIGEFLDLPQRTRPEAIQSLRGLFKGIDRAERGVRELEEIHEYLEALQVTTDHAAIDLSIARGLDYYTGPVFEAVLTDEHAAGFGSIMGGGRYDELIGNFTGEPVPATGASIGVDRLCAAMQRLELHEARSSTADVLVTVMVPERIMDYAKTADMLRREGIKTELYSGSERSIGKQLKYADRQGIPVAVIAGTDEFAAGTISLKDLRVIKHRQVNIGSREEWVQKKVGQRTIPLQNLLAEIRSILSSDRA